MTIKNNFHGGSFSGQCDPLFLFADGVRLNRIRPGAPCSEAERHRLVKASKSQTTDEKLEQGFKKAQYHHRAMVNMHCEPSWERAVVLEHERTRTKTPINARGCRTVVEFREWQEAWRVRTEAECITGTLPPSQSGLRKSEMLTSRGATKIAESCEFMHAQKGGYKTFVTGTFRDDVRARIVSGETSIQKEVTRTLDAMQKMYQRGWVKSDGEKVPGYNEGLAYLWVVEVPDNKGGEQNPHVHMLLGWSVAYRHFDEWSKRIESLWGNGYFHLEKIKDSSCAGAYMAKAAGYLCKAQDKADQGIVSGNRYGISKTARAPSWVVLTYAQINTMTQLIYDIYDHLTVKYGKQYQERKYLNEKLAKTPKNQKDERLRIGKRLAVVRQGLNKIPIRCNKYQVVIKGKAAMWSFFSWLQVPTSEGAVREEWLPEKPEGWHWVEGEKPKPEHTQFFSRLYEKFRAKRFWRRLVVPEWVQETFSNEYWASVCRDLDVEISGEPVPAYLDLCQ